MKRVLLAAVLATAVLAAAGCSGGDRAATAGPKATSASSPPPPAVTATPAVSDLNQVDLPLDRYTTTVDEYIELDYASKLMTADCMRRFGIRWNTGPRLKLYALRDRTNRLGLIDEAVAARAGYHNDPAHPEYYSSHDISYNGEVSDQVAIILQGVQPGRTAPKGVPQGGCTGEGYRKVGWNLDEDMWLQDLANDANERTFADKRALKVMADWSACMGTSGYQYAKPTDAGSDQRWWKSEDENAAATKAEKNTAVADVRCKKKVNYLNQMTAILTAYQQQIVETNLERLETVHQHVQDALKNAAAVVSGH
ncbi:hypothetical protein ACQP2F_41745 [Actinoplanes sp. CA-030573]|uniref:hypothetical protein n=1 Tax=Actinoplanes sp. CA-030573 TaxID=3239898 RepID=UPI003D94A07B